MTITASHPHQGRTGFSLLELLAVIVIIGILIGAASMLALPRPTPHQAAEITAAAIEQVRMEALASGKPTALLILAEPGDPDRLAKIQTVRQSGEVDSDNAALWEIIAPPLDIGNGILLNEAECTSDEAGSAAAKMRLPWRGGRQGDGLEWIAFGFTGEGIPLQPSGRLVFGRGTDAGFTSPDEDAAFILSDNGRPTPTFNFASLPE